MDVRVGDIITARKAHPCGGSSFLVLRAGMDFRIRCEKCGREIMAPRARIEKSIKALSRGGQNVCIRGGARKSVSEVGEDV